MNGHMRVATHPVKDYIGLFNSTAAQAARPDFKDMPVARRVEAVEVLHGLFLESEIFAAPVVDLLASLVGDRSFAVRRLIVTAMCDAVLKYEDIAPDAMSVLACLRDDEYADVRSDVAKMAGVIGHKCEDMFARAIDLLDIMKSDDNVVVRRQVANAIRLIGITGTEQAEVAKQILLEMKPDLDNDLNRELDERRREIDKAIENDFQDPPPPRGFRLG